jgi:arabinan endo-1,5-alpha-L-arabinosidase
MGTTYRQHAFNFLLCLLLHSPVVGGAASSGPFTFSNPLSDRDAADPSLLVVSDKMYLYSTGCGVRGGGAFPIRVSSGESRTSWTYVGGVFTSGTMPLWTAEGCRYWAPEVHRLKGQYVCYYSSPDRNNRFCIGVGTSPSPEGPFRDSGEPLVVNERVGLIDAGFFQDPETSRPWIMWKEDGNDLNPMQPTDMFIQELTDDGLSLLGNPYKMVTNDQEWEHELVEAPTLIYRGGYYYLFYSANVYTSPLYGVGVARSRSVTGPFEKYDRNPILRSNEDFDGPGHQFLLEETPGQWTMFYHARYLKTGRRSRLLMSDPVTWNDQGWPVVNNGLPSASWTLTLPAAAVPEKKD